SGDVGGGRMAELAAANALMGARGNSGVILSQFFRGIARGLSRKERASLLELAKAFQYGVVMAYRAVSKPVEGTILTVAREMARGARKASREGHSLTELLEAIVESGKKALERTTDQLPALKEAGVVDAGGYGFLVIMEGCLKALKGEIAPKRFRENEIVAVDKEGQVFAPDYLTFNYCTEFLIKGKGIPIAKIKKELQGLGDSLMVVGEHDLLKVHIHTNHPGEVLELCLKRGSLHHIKIDNMVDQHRSAFEYHGEEIQKAESGYENERSQHKEGIRTHVIAVCNGEGLEEIFNSLGCVVINGGPTMNPQVRDFVEAMRGLEGDVIILPNDKNIRLAAEQAIQLVDKRAEVLPTEDIPQGITAATAYKSSDFLEKNIEIMKVRYQEIKSGGVTYAVRDTSLFGKEIRKNDIIGLVGGQIAACGTAPLEVLESILEKMIEEDDEIITVFCGETVGEEAVVKIEEFLEEKYADKEVEVLYGGQPLYYYLVAVE
ncbi:MAG: DAK2 domain-containing protein, partial [Clostridia bacterium]|nr:DAK2 domain-containing protein [Clostridia bacterium]